VVYAHAIWKEKYGSDLGGWRQLPESMGIVHSDRGSCARILRSKLAGWGMPDLWLPLTPELDRWNDSAAQNDRMANFWTGLGE